MSASKRGMASNASRKYTCFDCNPLWDRKGNVKAIRLCNKHSATDEILEAVKNALVFTPKTHPMYGALTHVLSKAEGR